MTEQLNTNKDGFYSSDEFQAFFNQSSHAALIKANAPRFTIIAVSDTYLQMTQRKREEMLNQDFFAVFPGNAVIAAQTDSLLQSFERVAENKTTDVLPVYDSRVFIAGTGEYLTQYWSNNNEPVIDGDGNVSHIIRTIVNVTDKVLGVRAEKETGRVHSLLEREQALNEEMAATNEELKAVNEELHASQEKLNKLNDELERRVESRTREMKNSESRFRLLVEQIPVAINVFATHDLIVELPNDRMLEIWGRTFEEVAGKPLATGMPELEGQPFMQKLRDVISTGVPYASTEERAFIERRGKLEECYFDIVYQPVVNEDGTITSCLQIANEVTEEVVSRQRIQVLNEELTATNEELLQVQNDYIRAAEQSEKYSADLLFTIDAAGLATFDFNPVTGRFSGNDLLKSWFGLEPEEEIELQKATDVIAEADRERVVKAIGEALLFSSGGHYDTEYAVINPDNPVARIVKAKGKTLFNEEQMPVRLSGTLQDITEQKKDEQRKNDFIGMVSHEMKTPLTSLHGYVQLLQMNTKSEDAVAINMLGKANKQINRITTLINGFLNVSRLESGKIHIDKQRFDMANLIKEAEEEVVSTITSHKVIFAPVETIFVNADRDKINQVISNLIANAVKYSPANTIIRVACVNLNECAMVSVKDEGIGIKEEDQPKLFDRYYRVNNDNATSASGFGIGLYLCAEIIQRHDGKIWVESVVGKGSTFYFNLPVEKK